MTELDDRTIAILAWRPGQICDGVREGAKVGKTSRSAVIDDCASQLWVKRFILVPSLQLPILPQERTWHQFLGFLGALSMEADTDDRDIGICPVGAAPDRRQSYILRFRRAVGSGIIGHGKAVLLIIVVRGRQSYPLN